MTDGMMMQVWHDREAVGALQAWAKVQTDIQRARRDPRAPDCASLIQFKVQVEDSMTLRATEVVRRGLRMNFKVGHDEAAQDFVRDRLRQSHTALGNSHSLSAVVWIAMLRLARHRAGSQFKVLAFS